MLNKRADKLELLRIAEAVALEKSIDKELIINSMETGIAKSSLAIISQGTISSIAQSSPEDRRKIFEEAAGTSKYKKRKREALRKLENTIDHLDKINTILNELKKQLGPLSRQAEKTKIYLEKSKKLKNIEVALIAKDVEFYKNILKELEQKLENVFVKRQEYEDEISELEIKIDSKNSYKLNLENEIITLQEELDTISSKLFNLESISSKESHSRKLMIAGELRLLLKNKLKQCMLSYQKLVQELKVIKISVIN